MRLFIAIELDHAVKRVMLKTIDRLAEFRNAVRWVRETHMHLTLKFLGDVPDEQVSDVSDACARVAAACQPFEMVVDRCGSFPVGGRVRVIWCGSQGESSAAAACAARLDKACGELGFELESRLFSAHMTVGRVRDDHTNGRLRDAVQRLQPGSATQPVKELTLFQSTQSPQGPTHTALGRFPFRGTG